MNYAGVPIPRPRPARAAERGVSIGRCEGTSLTVKVKLPVRHFSDQRLVIEYLIIIQAFVTE